MCASYAEVSVKKRGRKVIEERKWETSDERSDFSFTDTHEAQIMQ